MEQLKQTQKQSQPKAGRRVDSGIALVFFGIFTALSFLLDNHTPGFALCDAVFLVGLLGAGLYLALARFRPEFSLGRKVAGL